MGYQFIHNYRTHQTIEHIDQETFESLSAEEQSLAADARRLADNGMADVDIDEATNIAERLCYLAYGLDRQPDLKLGQQLRDACKREHARRTQAEFERRASQADLLKRAHGIADAIRKAIAFSDGCPAPDAIEFGPMPEHLDPDALADATNLDQLDIIANGQFKAEQERFESASAAIDALVAGIPAAKRKAVAAILEAEKRDASERAEAYQASLAAIRYEKERRKDEEGRAARDAERVARLPMDVALLMNRLAKLESAIGAQSDE